MERALEDGLAVVQFAISVIKSRVSRFLINVLYTCVVGDTLGDRPGTNFLRNFNPFFYKVRNL